MQSPQQISMYYHSPGEPGSYALRSTQQGSSYYPSQNEHVSYAPFSTGPNGCYLNPLLQLQVQNSKFSTAASESMPVNKGKRIAEQIIGGDMIKRVRHFFPNKFYHLIC